MDFLEKDNNFKRAMEYLNEEGLDERGSSM